MDWGLWEGFYPLSKHKNHLTHNLDLHGYSQVKAKWKRMRWGKRCLLSWKRFTSSSVRGTDGMCMTNEELHIFKNDSFELMDLNWKPCAIRLLPDSPAIKRKCFFGGVYKTIKTPTDKNFVKGWFTKVQYGISVQAKTDELIALNHVGLAKITLVLSHTALKIYKKHNKKKSEREHVCSRAFLTLWVLIFFLLLQDCLLAWRLQLVIVECL